MNDKEIINMLKEVIKCYDYDGYKSLFVSPEEPEVSEKVINDMVAIIKKELK